MLCPDSWKNYSLSKNPHPISPILHTHRRPVPNPATYMQIPCAVVLALHTRTSPRHAPRLIQHEFSQDFHHRTVQSLFSQEQIPSSVTPNHPDVEARMYCILSATRAGAIPLRKCVLAKWHLDGIGFTPRKSSQAARPRLTRNNIIRAVPPTSAEGWAVLSEVSFVSALCRIPGNPGFFLALACLVFSYTSSSHLYFGQR